MLTYVNLCQLILYYVFVLVVKVIIVKSYKL